MKMIASAFVAGIVVGGALVAVTTVAWASRMAKFAYNLGEW